MINIKNEITLRNYLAGQALSKLAGESGARYKYIAQECYGLADAMLEEGSLTKEEIEERRKKQEESSKDYMPEFTNPTPVFGKEKSK